MFKKFLRFQFQNVQTPISWWSQTNEIRYFVVTNKFRWLENKFFMQNQSISKHKNILACQKHWSANCRYIYVRFTSKGSPHFLKKGRSRSLFCLVLSIQQITVNSSLLWKNSDRWIRTADIWNVKNPLCQMNHHYRPIVLVFQWHRKHLYLFVKL